MSGITEMRNVSEHLLIGCTIKRPIDGGPRYYINDNTWEKILINIGTKTDFLRHIYLSLLKRFLIFLLQYFSTYL